MLSRTANDLFWMSRQIERAENTARMLDITYRMSLLPYRIMEPGEKWAEPWALPLITTGLATIYYERHTDLTPDSVMRFMVLDASNPGSIYSSLLAARENARAQRGNITSEMWESINATWLEIRSQTFDDVQARGISDFFDWVKTRSHLFRGVHLRHHDPRRGLQLHPPRHVPRAGGQHLAHPRREVPHAAAFGGSESAARSTTTSGRALLRSVSAFESYRKIYRDVITPFRVAETADPARRRAALRCMPA